LGWRVIRTDLPYDEYVQLKKLVEKKRITMDMGVREAISQWIFANLNFSEDPLFEVKPVKTGVKTISSNLDKHASS
jgi:hypothetical protein